MSPPPYYSIWCLPNRYSPNVFLRPRVSAFWSISLAYRQTKTPTTCLPLKSKPERGGDGKFPETETSKGQCPSPTSPASFDPLASFSVRLVSTSCSSLGSGTTARNLTPRCSVCPRDFSWLEVRPQRQYVSFVCLVSGKQRDPQKVVLIS